MIKFIMHFFFYISSYNNIDKPIHTLIIGKEKTLSIYYYDIGYIEWEIEYKNIHYHNEEHVYGEFLLKKNSMKAILTIINGKATMIIMVDGKTEEIKLRK